MELIVHILIRTHRPESLVNCLASVEDCGYENREVHILDGTGHRENYSYNLLCNSMKAIIKTGYFFFLDDDDTIIRGSLAKIAPHLSEDKALICQMLRAGRPKPKDKMIKRGYIGLPCMILHHSKKDIADITQHEGGDYDWIKAVTDKIGYTFVAVPLVNSPKRSFGV